MANPSTEGPSGAGTEVLRRRCLRDNNNAHTSILTGVANHIYTILSIVWCEENDVDITIGLRIDVNAAGSNYVRMMAPNQALAAKETFVWNDKFVITGTDKLEVYSSAYSDIVCSYIDQQFAAP